MQHGFLTLKTFITLNHFTVRGWNSEHEQIQSSLGSPEDNHITSFYAKKPNTQKDYYTV
jgi:hypothetical protein